MADILTDEELDALLCEEGDKDVWLSSKNMDKISLRLPFSTPLTRYKG